MIVELLIATLVVLFGLWVVGGLMNWTDDKIGPDNNDN